MLPSIDDALYCGGPKIVAAPGKYRECSNVSRRPLLRRDCHVHSQDVRLGTPPIHRRTPLRVFCIKVSRDLKRDLLPIIGGLHCGQASYKPTGYARLTLEPSGGLILGLMLRPRQRRDGTMRSCRSAAGSIAVTADTSSGMWCRSSSFLCWKAGSIADPRSAASSAKFPSVFPLFNGSIAERWSSIRTTGTPSAPVVQQWAPLRPGRHDH